MALTLQMVLILSLWNRNVSVYVWTGTHNFNIWSGYIGMILPSQGPAHSGQCQPLKNNVQSRCSYLLGAFYGTGSCWISRREASEETSHLSTIKRNLLPLSFFILGGTQAATEASNRKHMISNNTFCQLSNNQAKRPLLRDSLKKFSSIPRIRSEYRTGEKLWGRCWHSSINYDASFHVLQKTGEMASSPRPFPERLPFCGLSKFAAWPTTCNIIQ